MSPTPAVGIIGATVMPHSLFLGSTLSTQDRVNFKDKHSDKNLATVAPRSSGMFPETEYEQPSWFSRFLSACKETIFSAFRKPPANYAATATRHSEHTNNSYEFVRAHIYHGTVDMIGSLLGFAVVINSLFVFQSLTLFDTHMHASRILILASSVFFYKNPNTGQQAASLFDAYDLIRDLIGLRMCFVKRC